MSNHLSEATLRVIQYMRSVRRAIYITQVIRFFREARPPIPSRTVYNSIHNNLGVRIKRVGEVRQGANHGQSRKAKYQFMPNIK